jgi:hypothetical protein
MYVTVRRYRGDMAAKDRIYQHVREVFLPMVSKLPGFVSYHCFDDGDGIFVSVSIFEKKSAEWESNSLAAGDVAEHLSGLLERIDITEGHAEVSEVAQTV